MNISVSSLVCSGDLIYRMLKLPPEVGVEIFWEWGGETYWNIVLEKIMRGRTGAFSIHAPYMGEITDMSYTPHIDKLLDYLKEPFELYHKYNGEGYVVHTHQPVCDYLPQSESERLDRVKRTEERLDLMNCVCKREGVNMLVENLFNLMTAEEYLALFEHNKELDCIIDVGHAPLSGLSVRTAQERLGSRIKAYHLHDNDGSKDQHLRILKGSRDWNRFFEGARAHTPDANFVLEYILPSVNDFDEIIADTNTVRELMRG